MRNLLKENLKMIICLTFKTTFENKIITFNPILHASMKMKKLLPFAASAFFCSLPLSANVLYWVDATSYFNADASGTLDGRNIWDLHRNFSDVEKSEYSDNYNWAAGYAVREVSLQDPESGQTTVYYVPVYEYASTVTAPDENTDVYFKFSDFSTGNAETGYRYRIAGSPVLQADTAVKSITVESANDNWLMFRTNGYDLTVVEDVSFNSTAVSWIGGSSASNIRIGGNVYTYNNSVSRYHAVRLGGDGVGSIAIGGDIIFESSGRIQMSTSGAESTFEAPQTAVGGIVNFSGYAARLDLGRRSATEQFYSFGGLSGSNSGAVISTDAEAYSNGLVSTLVLANSSDAVFAGKITNPATAEDNASTALVNTVNVVMNGSAAQTLSGDNDFRGYVTVQSGTLLLRTANGAAHGKLTLNGGKFGAIGNAAFSSAEWNGGSIGFFNTDEAVAVMTPETVTINGEFLKAGAGKIAVDFNGIDAYDLIDNGQWYDLIEAASLSGFSDEADDDFIAANLSGGYAEFQWVDGDIGKVLQVSFSSVPEPAAVALLLGFPALAFAARKRRLSK